MLETLFALIIKMSLAGSVVCLVIYAIKPITVRVFSSTWQYYMSAAVILILLVPFQLGFSFFEIGIPDEYSGIFMDEPTLIYLEGENAAINGNEPGKQVFLKTIWRILITDSDTAPVLRFIWICGMVIFTLFKLKSYLVFRKRIIGCSTLIENGNVFDLLESCRSAMRIEKKIKLATNHTVSTPMLVGLFRPTIVLPVIELSDAALRFVFTHELVHYKRHDLWLKALMLMANAVHWYNPIFLPLFKSINNACELSCDETVVEGIGYPQRKQYAETILCIIDKKTIAMGAVYFAMHKNAKNIKRRLNNMLNYKKTKKTRLVFSILLATAIYAFGIFITSATTKIAEATIGSYKTSAVAEYATSNSHMKQDAASKEADMLWPAPGNKRITSGYGMSTNKSTQAKQMHNAIDIAGRIGDPIVAAKEGVVVTAEWKGAYGNMVVVGHSDMMTVYAHCSDLLVKSGDKVEAGQVIAKIGSTGKSTGPHLHFEVLKNSENKDPLSYVSIPK